MGALNKQDQEGNTPLHLAAKAGSQEVGEILIKAGAAPKKNKEGLTPWDLGLQDPQRERVAELERKRGKLTCSVCLESVTAATGVATQCSHVFHPECLRASKQFRTTCPMCRQELDN